jgi:hypothetical protein
MTPSWLFIAVSLGVFDFRPKDAKMIRVFTMHQATFDRLVAMSDADARSKRFAPTFYPDSLYLPPVRLQAYRAALDSLHLTEGLYRLTSGDTVTVTFTAWGEGWAGMASEKGYLFSRTVPGRLASSLDDPRTLDRGLYGDAYRAIAPNWYLFYDDH